MSVGRSIPIILHDRYQFFKEVPKVETHKSEEAEPIPVTDVKNAHFCRHSLQKIFIGSHQVSQMSHLVFIRQPINGYLINFSKLSVESKHIKLGKFRASDDQ